jgi:molybdopterin-guanine dinucleotide biosynthesis protein A
LDQRVLIDGIVLAGGRSSRLGSVPKSGLVYANQTLLQRSLTAAAPLRRTVVVGGVTAKELPAGVLLTRENPPFGGPAAGIAAGVATLTAADPEPSDFVLVLACDMPRIGAATTALLGRLANVSDTAGGNAGTDGLVSLDQNERVQPLAAVYRTETLTHVLAVRERRGALTGLSVFQLISGMHLAPVPVPPGSTDDVDTWEDAARFGIPAPDIASRAMPR